MIGSIGVPAKVCLPKREYGGVLSTTSPPHQPHAFPFMLYNTSGMVFYMLSRPICSILEGIRRTESGVYLDMTA